MLSAYRIQRAYATHDMARVVRDLSDNGMDLPLTLRVRLGRDPVSAVALGLKRLVELSHGPTPTSRAMTAELLRRQRRDGALEAGGRADPLATACFAAAMWRLVQDQPRAVDRHLTRAHEAALTALAQMQGASDVMTGAAEPTFAGTADLDVQDRMLSSAFILYLLADDAAAHAKLRFTELAAWLDERLDAMPRPAAAYWRMARVTPSFPPPMIPRKTDPAGSRLRAVRPPATLPPT